MCTAQVYKQKISTDFKYVDIVKYIHIFRANLSVIGMENYIEDAVLSVFVRRWCNYSQLLDSSFFFS